MTTATEIALGFAAIEDDLFAVDRKVHDVTVRGYSSPERLARDLADLIPSLIRKHTDLRAKVESVLNPVVDAGAKPHYGSTDVGRDAGAVAHGLEASGR